MPIYEFYCHRCHAIFSFLSRKVNATKRPACPECGKPRLQRRPSSFAVTSGAQETPPSEGPPGLDEGRLEQAMESLAREADGVGDDDPRAGAVLMRRFYEKTGLRLGDGMQEALRRLEAGEDPDKIEEDLGDVLEGEDPLAEGGAPLPGRWRRRLRPPRVDSTLHEM